jgi:hypothetical protein
MGTAIFTIQASDKDMNQAMAIKQQIDNYLDTYPELKLIGAHYNEVL